MKIAVVGSGISGISAAWLLSSKYEVSLFEKEMHLGGHTRTIIVDEQSKKMPVDVGFLVYNEKTYPNLTRLFKYLDLEAHQSDMSLSLSIDSEKIEWSGHSINSVFSQRKNLFSLQFYRMLFDIYRFQKNKHLYIQNSNGLSLIELLTKYNYSTAFKNWYLLPMGGAIWSCSPEKMQDFPAKTFLTFCENHGLLQFSNRPVWKSLINGNFQYIEKMKSKIQKIYLNEPVLNCYRNEAGIDLETPNKTYRFDKVIFATHAPDTLRILNSPSNKEKEILSLFKYQRNDAYLHNSIEYMPKIKKNWSSWNFFTQKINQIGVSYFINRLQFLKTTIPYIVTLNPPARPKETRNHFEFEHPLFDLNTPEAQENLEKIQGLNNTFYCGAWTKYGFHEDGLTSALRIAKILEVIPPWMESE